MDFSKLPQGELGWSRFIAELSQTDDRVERHFLEVKSEVDLSSNDGRAKVAKFILGAANRDIEISRQYFSGKALMVLGVSKGSILGIPPFEAHELARFVANHIGIGENGPRWDFTRIPTSSTDRDVIIVIADPPANKMWACRKDGPARLANGEIYIRADGETRKATGEEVHEMLARATRIRPPTVDLTVDLNGFAYAHDDETDAVLEDYLTATRTRLSRRLGTTIAGPFGSTTFDELVKLVETRSPKQFGEEVFEWEQRTRREWPKVLRYTAGLAGRKTSVQILNNSDTFMEDVEVSIHVEGNVSTVRALNDSHPNPQACLPKIPLPYGESTTSSISTELMSSIAQSQFQMRPLQESVKSRPNYVKFTNGGSTTLTFNLETLRPQSEFTTPIAEFALVVDTLELENLHATWRVTARGHHRVYKGEFAIQVKRLTTSNFLRKSLLPTEAQEADDTDSTSPSED